jgi:hypothetical protein
MVRRRWLLLAVLVGLLSALAVWSWPAAPLWRRAIAEDGVVLGFGPDDRALYTAEGISGTAGNPRLCCWDVATGSLLGSVELSFPEHIGGLSVRLSPDAGTVVLADAMGGSHSWVCYLYDAATGRRRAGALTEVQHINPEPFSRNGAWFWVPHGSAAKPWDGIDVIESATGRRVVQLRDRGDAKPLDACFAPDGSAIAVHWRHSAKGAARDQVGIVKLPGGVEYRRFDLPSRMWQRVDKWVGERLYAEVDVPDGPTGHYFRRSYSFDLSAPSIGEGTEEPLLFGHVNGTAGQTYWEDGPGWLAHLSLESRQPKTWEQWLERLAAKAGFKYRARRGLHVSARFLDPDTGELRYEVPTSFVYNVVIANDGRRIAAVQPEGIVEVWDTKPNPRWPWASVAGIATACLILLLGRWRSLRLARGK